MPHSALGSEGCSLAELLRSLIWRSSRSGVKVCIAPPRAPNPRRRQVACYRVLPRIPIPRTWVNKGKKHLILIQSPILVWNTRGKWYEKREEAQSVVDR